MLTKKTTLLLIKILEKAVTDNQLHFRLLNTFSYLEYIGTRKILKALPAHMLNKTILEHINEEVRHSLFFKIKAQKLAKKSLGFKPHEMVASHCASAYFQEVDKYSSNFSFSNPFLNYLYTTLIVEQRVLVVYSLYNEILKRSSSGFSLNGILKEEEQHLDFVYSRIQVMDPLFEQNLENLKTFEHQKYFALLISLEQEIFSPSSANNFHSFIKGKDTPYYTNL